MASSSAAAAAALNMQSRQSTPTVPKMIDLSAIRSIRAGRGSDSSFSPKVSVSHHSPSRSPLKGKAPALPLPRRLRRLSALNSSSSPSLMSSTATTAQNDSQRGSSNEDASSTLSQLQSGPSQPKPVLPRRTEFLKSTQPASAGTSSAPLPGHDVPISALPRTASAPSGFANVLLSLSAPAANASSPDSEHLEPVPSPPRSRSPTASTEDDAHLRYPTDEVHLS